VWLLEGGRKAEGCLSLLPSPRCLFASPLFYLYVCPYIRVAGSRLHGAIAVTRGWHATTLHCHYIAVGLVITGLVGSATPPLHLFHHRFRHPYALLYHAIYHLWWDDSITYHLYAARTCISVDYYMFAPVSMVIHSILYSVL
jgi:hypothetical protein